MPRIRLAVLEQQEKRERFGRIANDLKGKFVQLGPAEATALAALAVKWGVAPEQALKRALLGIATALGS
jgi:hypothetical protein